MKRYILLDIVRGVAALTIVLWHWNHFQILQEQQGLKVMPEEMFPLYSILMPFYRYGASAVDFFFILSGFIFTHTYSNAIRFGKLSLLKYALLRFSRLYPLHFTTLIFVAALQYCYRKQHGMYFVYQQNDFHLFLLQLVFASNWLPNSSFSFNGPIWSVSVEVLMYILFFFVCRFGANGLTQNVGLALLGSVVAGHMDTIGRGLFGFFSGVLCYKLVEAINSKDTPRMARACLSIMLISVGSFIVLFTLRKMQVTFHNGIFFQWVTSAILFPLMIICFALAESALHLFALRLEWIGQISYSSYLIHFPLQLFIALVINDTMEIDYSSPVTLGIFTASLISLSLISFRMFERPIQNYIRATLYSQAR
jgi:peptidoglycan/LPS O-acetylase OafA/YrhL